ncbi:hypothetical protein POM88_000144 [Heracleum sosnowskyi]|uniref:NPH3 domain-containing protein n=1 Tax=Heracleum sosnowskyi TaxID=360622 RepID=A0AAD8JAM8_9APIA|nr:hypothetical protein POM88_000144 [Heracleum sosnowskyi]
MKCPTFKNVGEEDEDLYRPSARRQLFATTDCTNGFEVRIGKQLDQATVKHLLIPSLGYAREQEYDTDCIRRILKHFYSNLSSPEDYSLIFKVAELVENYLAEVASDVNLKKSTFMSLAEMAFAASVETERLSDGLYRAIDTPEKHLVKDVISSDDGLVKPREEEISKGVGGSSESRAMVQMERMNCKVTELEKECSVMKKEIWGIFGSKLKREKGGVWREMKRKFRCTSTTQDYDNCHVKKKKIYPK